MSEPIKTTLEEARWDLSCLYAGLDDPRIEEDLARWTAMAKQFFETHRGRLAETLGSALREYATLEMLADKLGVYAELRLAQDLGNDEAKEVSARIRGVVSDGRGDYLTFFKLEVGDLPEADLARHVAGDSLVKKHLSWLSQVRLEHRHDLSEEVESALDKRAIVAQSWDDYFEQYEADLRFPWEGRELDLEEMLEILGNNKEAEKRALALKTVNDGLNGHFREFAAQLLFTIAQTKDIDDRQRGYRHPMDEVNQRNGIPDEVVEALHEAVEHSAAPLARRYYRLKAAHLGQKTLRWSDRNAPMPFVDDAKVEWGEAVNTVIDAYAEFSPTLAGLIREMIRRKHTDAFPDKGRQQGAFNISLCLTEDTAASFDFLNYQGSRRDAGVMAHEWGHGVHGILAGVAQGPLMLQAPMAYAETASVFGESLAFDAVYAKTVQRDRREALALVMSKLDDIINTVVRQISFSNFERRVHGLDTATMTRREFRRFSAAELNGVWVEESQRLYGPPGEVFTYEDMENLWSFLGHFHNPFYVYSYACGELLTHSLMATRERLGERFEPLYLDLLRAGKTKNIVELLAPFGLDPRDPDFWRRGVEISLGRLLRLAEELSAEMGVMIE